MVAISLILIGGCSVLRSRTSLRTCGSKVPRRAAACSAPNRPRMPSFSKLMIRRRRVVSGVPVWRALSVTGLPKTTGGRIRSYSTCSGHFRSSLSCPQSSVGSTRVRLAICRSPPATPFLLPPASSFPSPRADVAISSGSSHSSSVFRGDRMPRQWTRGKFPPPMIQICVTSLWRGLDRKIHLLQACKRPIISVLIHSDDVLTYVVARYYLTSDPAPSGCRIYGIRTPRNLRSAHQDFTLQL